MTTKNHRVPLAFALAALFAATLVPVSGAESLTPVYTFNMGSAGDPTWVMLKLNVTQPSVTPSVTYRTAEFHCPSTWGTSFMTGSPGNTDLYNGFGWDLAYGRTGVDARVETPPLTIRTGFVQNDGQEACAWQNTTVIYQELPVGTVYVLQRVAGVPFVSTSIFSVDGPGVSVVGTSSGTTSFYGNETDWNGYGGVVHGPPFCGAFTQAADCPPNAMNPGGVVGGASVHALRFIDLRFKHRPFFTFVEDHRAAVANASVEYPNGDFRYLPRSPVEVAGVGVRMAGMMVEPIITDRTLAAPAGMYRFAIEASAEAGLAYKPGWHLSGADVWFPEEAR